MAMASCFLRSPMFTAPQTDQLNNHSLGCSRDYKMDARTSAVVDKTVESANETYSTEKEEAKQLNVSAVLMNFGNKFDLYGAMSSPPYQTATYKQPSATEYGPYDYTRGGNPTRDVLESLMAKLDKADKAFCFSSGMAALSSVSHLVEPGEEIVAGEDIYGGSDRLLSQIIPKRGIMVESVQTTNVKFIRESRYNQPRCGCICCWAHNKACVVRDQQIHSNNFIIFVNCKITHDNGALLMVNNSIMFPVLCQPLELGAGAGEGCRISSKFCDWVLGSI